MGLFKKKSADDGFVVNHYEGLPSFKQDFPCNMKVVDGAVVFSNNGGSTASLNAEQITNIDWLREDMFMGKYHNNPVNTGKAGATKWFAVINYKSSSGEEKYIAFWSLNSKAKDFLLQNVNIKPQNITL